jgi:2',3'-cyclic-nucleotide 2'-phosphodiesterase (5'-nucleotidase family)
MKLLTITLLSAISFFFGGCRQRPADEIHILYSGNLSGYLELCGCPEGRVGGMARFATAVKESLSTWQSRTLLIDAGDLIDPETPGDTLRTHWLLAAYKLLGYQAVNVTGRDVQAGLGQFVWAHDSLSLPLISANLIDSLTGNRSFPPWVIFDLEKARVGVIGLSAPENLKTPSGATHYAFTDPQIALHHSMTELRPKCDLLILLCDFTVREARNLGKEVQGIDLIISTKDLAPTGSPKSFGSAFVIGPSHKGKYLTSLALQRDSKTKWNCSYSERLLDAKISDDLPMSRLIEEYRHLKRMQSLHSNEH